MSLLSHIAKSYGQPSSNSNLSGDMPKIKPFEEMGQTGLLRTKGNNAIVFEEWLSSLSSYRQRQVYREMRDNDAGLGAMFFALEMILRQAEWYVEAGKANSKGEQYAQFFRDCMEDMSHPWSDFIGEAVNMFVFGFSLFETVYKRRQGPDGKKASKFDDGLIGWRKMAPRSQESIMYWSWDDAGGLQGAVQLAAPDYIVTTMPIEKLLLFRTTSIKNNPEGRSVLRNCYRPWTFKKRLEEVIGIGIERDVCGLPVLTCSAEGLKAMGGMDNAKRIVTNIRIDDQMGVILPMANDEKGQPHIKLELIKAAGAKQTDGEAAIKRHNQEMFNTILAGFIEFGQGERGSRSLHMSATQIFAQAISAFMASIADVFNRIAVPRLMALNAMDLSLAPKLVPGEIGVRDLDELASYVQKLSASGLTFFDKDTASFLRKAAKMPDQPADDAETREVPLDDPDEPQGPGTKPAAAAPPQGDQQAEHQLATAV